MWGACVHVYLYLLCVLCSGDRGHKREVQRELPAHSLPVPWTSFYNTWSGCDIGLVPCGPDLRAPRGAGDSGHLSPRMGLGWQGQPARCPQRFQLSNGCRSKASS